MSNECFFSDHNVPIIVPWVINAFLNCHIYANKRHKLSDPYGKMVVMKGQKFSRAIVITIIIIIIIMIIIINNNNMII